MKFVLIVEQQGLIVSGQKREELKPRIFQITAAILLISGMSFYGYERRHDPYFNYMLMFVAIVILVIVILVALSKLLSTFPDKRIAEIISSKEVLAKWSYSKEEWQIAVEDEFVWVKDKEKTGQVYITFRNILITNGKDNLICDLAGGDKVLTHASYIDSSPLGIFKIRVRWKTIVATRSAGPVTVDDEEQYDKKDYRIPVPPKYKEEAKQVSEYFKRQIDRNVAAVQNVLPRSVSLLGKDI